MPIFKEENGKLKKLKIHPFTKEKNLQNLIEQNLLEVLEMHLLATEYSTTFGGRIDTLAVDMNGAPVIIEYKLNKNDNVINQAISYLRWLKAQKMGFFEMLVIKKLGKEIAEQLKIDWSNPRIICIAESYSKFDIDTVEILSLNMRLELYKYHCYDDGIFSLEPLNMIEQRTEKVDKTSKIPVAPDALDINHALPKISTPIQKIFEELRNRILQIDKNIVEKQNTSHLVYRLSKNFVEVSLNKQQIRLLLRPVDYDDPLNKVEQVPESFKWTLNKRVNLREMEELDYIMKLIEQSYLDVI